MPQSHWPDQFFLREEACGDTLLALGITICVEQHYKLAVDSTTHENFLTTKIFQTTVILITMFSALYNLFKILSIEAKLE